MIQTVLELIVVGWVLNEGSAHSTRTMIQIQPKDLPPEVLSSLLEKALPEFAPDNPKPPEEWR